MNEILNLEPEFYPIDRLLLAGPLEDVIPLADRAHAAGHTPALLLPAEQIESARAQTKHRILASEETIGDDDFDLVLELHCTDLEAKADSLYFLEDALGETVPILTLTMAISLSDLTRDLLMPERVLGISLLPPVDSIKLVELMRGEQTADPVLQTAKRFFESIDIKTKEVADSPGGVLVRTICCLINEAALALQERIATFTDIDTALKLGVDYPEGPLAWGDKIGLDRVEAVMDGLHAWFKEDRYRCTPLLKKLVRNGYTGVTAGQGFYQY
ncbi:3-hydroxybutyryl-CoA dehydrogenase [bacterium]|nr:3-hydroxybutyryl-CoA dehydrogenase [bacterium]